MNQSPPASVFLVIGPQVCTTVSGCVSFRMSSLLGWHTQDTGFGFGSPSTVSRVVLYLENYFLQRPSPFLIESGSLVSKAGFQLPQVVKNDLEQLSLLPVSPECWNYRLACLALRLKLGALCMQGHSSRRSSAPPQPTEGPSGVSAHVHDPRFSAAPSLLRSW